MFVGNLLFATADGWPVGRGGGSPTRSDKKPWTVSFNAQGSSVVRQADVITVWC
ncbi:hypothetical protein ACFFTQ_27695 [Streptomyces roseofulvus]|uniref:hypothetical protein n=1 Tax=Streptomyces roseofulvus TaxID=33902 RepID=UPI0031F9D3E2